jgi:Zn-dependent protease/CBS domain-containing protein
MLFKRHTHFHVFGFEIKADASWLFLVILIGWMLSTKTFPAMLPGQQDTIYQFMAVAAIAGILVSIIAHEVAHAIIAEYYKMPILGITLFIFGGVAEMKGEPSHPKGECLMAIAGPAMSLMMGLIFNALSNLSAVGGADSISVCLAYLGTINFIIAAANMLPAFPLDGGRALRAILWARKKNLVEATRIASSLGATFAYGILGYACYVIVMHDDLLQGMWWSLFGFFLHGSASYAVQQTEHRTILGPETVARFMLRNPVTISPDLTITEVVDRYISQHYQRSFPVVENGRLVGLLNLQSILVLDRHKWQWLHVGSTMEPVSDKNSIAAHTSAAEAMDHMQRENREFILVAENEKLQGILSIRDIMAYLSINTKIDQDRSLRLSR